MVKQDEPGCWWCPGPKRGCTWSGSWCSPSSETSEKYGQKKSVTNKACCPVCRSPALHKQLHVWPYCTLPAAEIQASCRFLETVHKAPALLLNTLPNPPCNRKNAPCAARAKAGQKQGAKRGFSGCRCRRGCSPPPRPRRSWRRGSGFSPPGGWGRKAGGTFWSSRCRCTPAGRCRRPPGRWG